MRQETKRKTAIKSKTLNPTFNEMIEYKGLSRQDVASKSLQVSVHGKQIADKKLFLGGTVLNLGDTGMLKDHVLRWHPLNKTLPKPDA